jgi:Autographiviridae terminase large subunit
VAWTKEEIKAAGLDDFRVFLRQVWDFLGLPPPTPVQNDIAYNLQHGPRRLIVQGFRGVGKSWITAAFVCWLLFCDPDTKIMIVSASQGLADDMSGFIKQLLKGMPMLQHLQPDEGRDSAIKFDVGPARESKDPSVKSVGITGQLTGSRANVIVADDVEVPKNAYTHLLRERLAELVKEFDAVLKPGGRIVYLGTPQVEATLYNRLRKRGYEIMVWPAEIPKKLEQYAGKLAKYVMKLINRGAKAHDPVDSKRFSTEDLAERRASYGASGYALQFMLDTSLSDAEKHPLKASDLIIQDVNAERGHVSVVWSMDRDRVMSDLQCGGLDGDAYYRPMWISEEMEKWQGTVMAIDPSGRGLDETSYAIVRYLYGTLFLVASGGFVDGFGPETLQKLAEVAIKHGVNEIIDEPNYGGGMFRNLLKPVMIAEAEKQKKGSPRFVPEDEWNGWASSQKEMRILDTLTPILTNHRLVVDRQVILDDLKQQEDKERYSLIQQLTRMERVKGALPNEDRLEAVSMACAFWTDRMDRDRAKMLDKAKELEIDRMLRRFRDGITNPRGIELNLGRSKSAGRFI